MVKHHAFTMIELIFAIVVISIAVVSLPMMIQVNNKALEGNIKQEAIFATSAKMMQILSFAWDQNSTDTNISKSMDYSKVIDTTGGNAAYNRVGTTIFRVGHIREGLHRRYFSPGESIDTNISTSMDGYTGISKLEAIDKDGYKYDMQLNTVITTVDDTPANPFTLSTATTPSTNIKMITITTTIDSNNDHDYNDPEDEQIVLRSYAANIGEIDFNKRRY